MRRWIALSAALLALSTASPAWAHEEINPSTVPTGKPVFFTLNAANEKNVDLTKITLNAPSGTSIGETTHEPAGWTVNRTDTAVTWTGGAVKPNKFDSWGFEIEGADQPGAMTWKVNLTYADNSTDEADVVVTAVAGSGTGATAKSGGTSSSTANAALVLAILALLAGFGAFFAARQAAKGTGAKPAAPAATSGQDW